MTSELRICIHVSGCYVTCLEVSAGGCRAFLDRLLMNATLVMCAVIRTRGGVTLAAG